MRRNRSMKERDLREFEHLFPVEAQDGSTRSEFESTAIPHMSALFSHALRLTMNPDDANDLLQETYLKAYRFWDKFEKGTNIKGWLYQIMKNSFINQYRKRVKEPKAVEFDETLMHPAAETESASEGPQTRMREAHDMFEDAIARSLETLPRDFRTVVMMSDVEDLSYEEIASAIAVPLGTVRSRLHRGRRLLRERLGAYARTNRYLL